MDVSFFQLTSLTCPQCRTACEARIWLVVDATERADLLGRVCNEILHDLTCPNCNQTIGQIDAPLLIYQPGKMPPLLFSPAQQTTPEQVVGLVSTLRRRLNKASSTGMCTPYTLLVAPDLVSFLLEEEAGQRESGLCPRQEDIVVRLFPLSAWAGTIALIVLDDLLEGGDDRSTIQPKAPSLLDQLISCCHRVPTTPFQPESRAHLKHRCHSPFSPTDSLSFRLDIARLADSCHRGTSRR